MRRCVCVGVCYQILININKRNGIKYITYIFLTPHCILLYLIHITISFVNLNCRQMSKWLRERYARFSWNEICFKKSNSAYTYFYWDCFGVPDHKPEKTAFRNNHTQIWVGEMVRWRKCIYICLLCTVHNRVK